MENINVAVDEIKDICKRHGENMDPLWISIRQEFNLPRLSQAGDRKKRNGIPVSSLFETSVAMSLFLSGTVKGFFASRFGKIVDGAASAFYRFSQDSLFNWRMTVFAVSKLIRTRETEIKLEAKYPTALILDDSTLEEAGRRIEGISKVHDHVSGRHVPGFKLLGLAFFNGSYARMLDFNLVAERKLSLKNGCQFVKYRASNSHGKKRKRELKKDKITLAAELLARAAKNGYAADYVLVDSWFTCAALINKACSLNAGKTDFLGMVKADKRLYIYNGQSYTLSQLRHAVMSEKKRCKRFKSSYMEVTCELKNVGAVKLFFSRFSRNKKWVCLLTTDLDMSYVKAIEIYAIRWNIEVMFKECKQMLGLGKCQSNDFDAQIAHASSVFIAHSMLVYFKYREDYQTLGQLYSNIEAQYTGLLTVEKILLMLEEVLTTVAAKMGNLNKVSLHEVLNAPEYAAFKEAIRFSLLLNQNGIINKDINHKEVTAEEKENAA